MNLSKLSDIVYVRRWVIQHCHHFHESTVYGGRAAVPFLKCSLSCIECFTRSLKNPHFQSTGTLLGGSRKKKSTMCTLFRMLTRVILDDLLLL